MQPTLYPLVFGIGFAFLSQGVFGQSVEGRVELPKPAAERGIAQRYQGTSEAPTPSDPPVAVVYLEGIFPAAAGRERPVAQMAQKDISFEPAILPVQVGTTVEFPNLDDTYHNVFSYSKVKRFDLGRYRKEENPGVVLFDKSGVVTLHCEVHEMMRGTILVLDTPYFQKTDAQGFFRLSHLPAGRYLLKAWINDKDVRSQPVVLTVGTALHVNFPAK